MDLVDEQQRALAGAAAAGGFLEHLACSSATPENTAEICTKCSPAGAASKRAIVVLPTPGGPQRISEASEPRSTMRDQRAVGAEQVVLADHLGEAAGAQAVGQRTRGGLRAGGFRGSGGAEQVRGGGGSAGHPGKIGRRRAEANRGQGGRGIARSTGASRHWPDQFRMRDRGIGGRKGLHGMR